jgi:hypothetical protein
MRRGNRVFEGEYTLSVRKVERPYGRDKPLPETSERYSDAQLYRILVAEALTDGAVSTKAEFDEMVHQIRNIQDADELIAFRNLRPGCKAWRHGKMLVCECGAAWVANDPAPPPCKPQVGA